MLSSEHLCGEIHCSLSNIKEGSSNSNPFNNKHENSFEIRKTRFFSLLVFFFCVSVQSYDSVYHTFPDQIGQHVTPISTVHGYYHCATVQLLVYVQDSPQSFKIFIHMESSTTYSKSLLAQHMMPDVVRNKSYFSSIFCVVSIYFEMLLFCLVKIWIMSILFIYSNKKLDVHISS